MVENLVGKKIHELTILEEYRKEDKKIYYKAKCSCGKIVHIRRDSLLYGYTKSCGHIENKGRFKRNDLTGKKYGRLTVIEFAYKKNNELYYLCECECGNKVIKKANALTTGRTKSCGCLIHETSTENAQKMNKERKDKYIYKQTSIPNIKSQKLNKNNTSGCKGVYFDKSKNKWAAEIFFQGKKHHLGRYIKIEDAIKARKDAEEKYIKPILEEFERKYK